MLKELVKVKPSSKPIGKIYYYDFDYSKVKELLKERKRKLKLIIDQFKNER